MKKTALLILGLLALAQLLVPAAMILKHERILRQGELFRFKTAPLDPADPFQGRYVLLNFDSDSIRIASTNAPAPGRKERVYVVLGTDAEGFCELKEWSRTRPESGAFLKTTSYGIGNERNPVTEKWDVPAIRFDLPFDRFYMDEEKAPRAEALAREETRATNCWAAVRVYKGAALIEDVFIGDISLRTLAARPE